MVRAESFVFRNGSSGPRATLVIVAAGMERYLHSRIKSVAAAVGPGIF